MLTNTSPSDAALYYLEDTMERVLGRYFLLGETAKQIVDNSEGDLVGPIEVGMLRTDYTQFVHSSLKMLLPFAEFSDNAVTFEHQGIPITIKIIDKNYVFFKDLDTKFFKVTQFPIPNPFSKYWKVRKLVK